MSTKQVVVLLQGCTLCERTRTCTRYYEMVVPVAKGNVGRMLSFIARIHRISCGTLTGKLQFFGTSHGKAMLPVESSLHNSPSFLPRLAVRHCKIRSRWRRNFRTVERYKPSRFDRGTCDVVRLFKEANSEEQCRNNIVFLQSFIAIVKILS